MAARAFMVEAAAEASEALMDKYLNEGELSEAEIIDGLRQRTLKVEIVPVFCGTAFKNKGVQAMLDGVVHLLPSPSDRPPVAGIDEDDKEDTRPATDTAPFSALAFKIMTDPFVGSLTFFRVYSGMLNSGDAVYNPVKSKKERVGRILQMHSNERSEIKEVRAGDIAAAVGLKDVTTGDTLCAQDHIITLERMIFPEPVISMAVEPKTKSDQEKMGIALGRLAQEDPSFRVRTDEESGQTIIAGMGELHLDILVDRMKREFNVEANVGKPQVAYRETIRKAVKQEGKFVRQSGGRGQYGHIVIEMAPQERGVGFTFENAIVGGVVPKEYVTASGKGIEEAMKSGPLAGFPVVDVSVKAVDGSFHDVDSNEMAFKVAGSMAFKEAFAKANPGVARADDEGRDRDARGLSGRRDGRRQPDQAAHRVRGRSLRPEQGRGRPSHAVLQGLPSAVLLPHDRRDRRSRAARGRRDGDAGRQREDGDHADQPGGDGRRPAFRDPRRRPHRWCRRRGQDPQVIPSAAAARLSRAANGGPGIVRNLRSAFAVWRKQSHGFFFKAYASSSIGRAAVSKTAGWGFKSLLACH